MYYLQSRYYDPVVGRFINSDSNFSNNNLFRYVYDDIGQLVREDNTFLNETYVYEYDNAGNITKSTPKGTRGRFCCLLVPNGKANMTTVIVPAQQFLPYPQPGGSVMI